MKQTIHIASVLLLFFVFFVPAAAADVSILNGTVVIHTTGDPGVSALGDPVLRVIQECPGYTIFCKVGYGDPGGLVDYGAGA